MTVGIYKLEFTDGSFYVGRSVSIESRYKDHIRFLKNNSNRCSKLQNKFNKIDELPKLEILEECQLNELPEKEKYWINTLDAINIGLNILPGGDDILLGEKHPNSKYTNSQILEVVRLLGMYWSTSLTHDNISSITGVSVSTIKDILSKRSHAWVSKEYPEEYQKMIDAGNLRKSNSLKNLNPFANKKVEEYPEIMSPDGTVYRVEHLTNFCREHNLTPSNLCKVFSGERLQHKGWRLYKCK